MKSRINKSKIQKIEDACFDSDKANREQGTGTPEQGLGVTLRNGLVGEKNRLDPNSLDPNSLEPKYFRQQAFLSAYRSNFFNITQACQVLGISRQIFYRWRNNDKQFQENLEEVEAELKDFIRGKLLELIQKGNLIATIFGCKSICGMVEAGSRSEVKLEHSYSKQTIDAMVAAHERIRDGDRRFSLPSPVD